MIGKLALESKDIKTLKRKRLFQLIFFIYMMVVTIGVLGLDLFLYFDDEPLLFKLMLVGFGASLFVVVKLYQSYMKLKSDLRGNLKEVVQGTITEKSSHKNSHTLTIEGRQYQIDYLHYTLFQRGDNVLMSFAPLSRVVLDIHEL